jgi:ADP-dependent NAD(P)H-hydrate dehydratase / NAD(P)H-hydrate epimerase
MKLVTVSEMREIEQQANASGLSYEQMMDKAGQGVARYVLSHFPDEKKSIVGLVGGGNNGGDTLVALASLAKAGWMATAYMVKSRGEGDALTQWFLQSGGKISIMTNDAHFRQLEEWIKSSPILLDGVLGTGAEFPLKPEVAMFLKFVSTIRNLPVVIAVDCPSGVDCSTGEAAAECIPADITLCMAAVKTGLLQFPAYKLVGELDVIDIGVPKKLESWAKINREVVTAWDVSKVLPKRPDDANKGTFGTAMIAAGSINYMGAALLAGKAAYRVGTGLVKLAVIEPLPIALAGALPEATWVILPNEMGVIAESAADVVLKNLEKVTALLLGPGWGLEETTGRFIEHILANKNESPKLKRVGFLETEEVKPMGTKQGLPPLIIDADGLKLLSKIKDWEKLLPKETVLTPHPGEMAVLTGKKVAEIQADRMGIALEYAKKWNVILVLKGAITVIAEPGGQIKVIPVTTAALAKAGTGDVLAGMITGFRAQGLGAFEAAWTSAWVHAQAGLLAADADGGTTSILASEIADIIPDVLTELD